MTQAQWFDLETTFSYRFAMDNVPRAIAQALLDVVDMEVSEWGPVPLANKPAEIPAGALVRCCN